MRVFICGSLYEKEVPYEQQRQQIKNAALEIGKEIGRKGWTIIVGTDIEHSVDLHVIRSALEVARSESKEFKIEVYYIQNIPRPFSRIAKDHPGSVKYHRVDSDNWHVAHMAAVDTCDCMLLLAGRSGTLVSGLYAMLHRIPFIPIPQFEGGAYDVWHLSKNDPQKYYFGAIDRKILDELYHPWTDNESATLVANNLKKVYDYQKRYKRLAMIPKAIAGLGLLLGIAVYSYFLYLSTSDQLRLGLLFLMFSAMFSGLAGSSLAIILEQARVKVENSFDSIITMISGIGKGFIAFLLLPFIQFFAKGNISINLQKDEYVRFMVLAGVLGIYSGLTEKALVSKLKELAEAIVTKIGRDEPR